MRFPLLFLSAKTLTSANMQINGIIPLQGEEWQPVRNYEGIYAISNFGRLAHNTNDCYRVLKLTNSKGWYFGVRLRKDGKYTTYRIHRLVYSAFVGEIPKGKNWHIHHKNGNKQDNRIENLELLFSSEHHLIDIDKHTTTAMNYYNQEVRPKSIIQKTMNGEFIAMYRNAKDASMASGVCQRNILQVANKTPFNVAGAVRKQAGGYIWEFAS